MYLDKNLSTILITFCVWLVGLNAKTATIQIFTDSLDWETIIKTRSDFTYNTFEIQDNGFVSGQLRTSISGQFTYSPDFSIVASNVIDIRNYRKDDNGDGIYDILDPDIYYQDSFTGTESGTYYQNSSIVGSVNIDTTFFVTREVGSTDLNARITGVVTSSIPQLNSIGDITENRDYYTLGWSGSLDYGRTTYQSSFTNNESGEAYSAESKISITNENSITLEAFPLPNASGSIVNTDIILNRKGNLFHKQFVVGEITHYFRLIDEEDSDADGIPDISDLNDSNKKTIFVDDNASEGGDGSSWANAHKYLQDALAVAKYGDEIWVAEGTYKPTDGSFVSHMILGHVGLGNRSKAFNLIDGVHLYGGFSGYEISRVPLGDSNQTLLSGEIGSDSSLCSLHIVVGYDLKTETVLDGFRITQGNANGLGQDSRGGGMYLENSTMKIVDCVFSENQCVSQGGGIYNSGCNLIFENCEFVKNKVSTGNQQNDGLLDEGGGGIMNIRTLAKFSNCNFVNNSVFCEGWIGVGGGAINNQFSNLYMDKCDFIGNFADADIEKIRDLYQKENYYTFFDEDVADGGAISDWESNASFTYCLFRNNSCQSEGGAIQMVGSATSTYKLTNCVFDGNTAKVGGSFWTNHPKMSLINCVFVNNIAKYDASLSVYEGGEINLINTTIVGNTSTAGNYIIGYWYTDFNMINSILWGNLTTNHRGYSYVEADQNFTLSEKHGMFEESGMTWKTGENELAETNILQGWNGDDRALDTDPLFANFDDAIGPDDKWFTKDDGLRLIKTSPLIDAGHNDSLPLDSSDLDEDENTNEPLPHDILGQGRNLGIQVDIGAYEFDPSNPPIFVVVRNSLFINTLNGGSVSGSGYFKNGTSTNISATPSTGYIFSSWSGDVSSSLNPLTIIVDSDKSITANFSQDLNDNDGDGLSNYTELITYETDPNSYDTDNDGLSDKQEIDRGWNANSSDKTIVDAIMEMKGMDGGKITPFVNGWFYLPNQGWIWTNSTTYPYFFDSTSKAWMYFQSGNDYPRFYHYGTKQWITME